MGELRDALTVLIESVTLFPCVNSRMTITAEKHQVIPIQRYVWICNVVSCQMNLVMNDNTGIVYPLFKTAFTQSSL